MPRQTISREEWDRTPPDIKEFMRRGTEHKIMKGMSWRPLHCEKCHRLIALPADEITIEEDHPMYGGRLALAQGAPVRCPYHESSTYWLRPFEALEVTRG